MKINYQKIYEQLGYLFYALASANKHLREREYEVLKKDIERDWIPLENSTDEFGTDAANYIYFTYDSLVDQDYPPLDAFKSFRQYFQEHSPAFDEEIRGRIKKTALDMANTFPHPNKTEEYIIRELQKMLSPGERKHNRSSRH
ncbi:MAG TPA: hypothetical protein VKZ68_02510 [Ohtaekwangia sp.]|nr:hypothetical protein [Ohtaekwangia sp.]